MIDGPIRLTDCRAHRKIQALKNVAVNAQNDIKFSFIHKQPKFQMVYTDLNIYMAFAIIASFTIIICT